MSDEETPERLHGVHHVALLIFQGQPPFGALPLPAQLEGLPVEPLDAPRAGAPRVRVVLAVRGLLEELNAGPRAGRRR